MPRASTLHRQALRGPSAFLTIATFLIVFGSASVRAADATVVVEANAEESKSADAVNARSLVGPWQVSSLTIRDKNGNPEAFGGRTPRPCSVIFGERTATLRVGAESIAEVPYVLDSAQDPCTIDVKTDAGALLGIYKMRRGQLQIGLNDEAKGRPSKLSRQENGLYLGLNRFPSLPLFVINADGTDLHQILALPEFTCAGSPDWSRDGRQIAFDATRTIFGEDWNSSHIFVVNADGSSPKDMGPGAMPSWSHDNKQLSYVQYEPERGVSIMNADGSGRQLIDSNGWGSQWSPLRNEIAYAVSEGGRPNICIYDVGSKQRRTLLEKGYRQIYEGFTWSPDGKWICFKGDLIDGGSELAAVSVAGEKQGFKVILPKSAQPESGNVSKTMAWGGTGNQILVTMQTKTDRMLQMYILDFAGVEPPRLFSGFPKDWMSDDMAWSPDGKKVIFSARPPVSR